MMKKYWRIVFAAIVLVLLLSIAVHIKGAIDLRKTISTCSALDEYQVTVKNYTSGNSYEIVDHLDREKIVEGFLKVTYRGLCFNTSPITKNDEAYSIIISSKNVHVVLIAGTSQAQCRLVGNFWPILIGNSEDLYLTVKNILAYD